ncbi:single-stranded-DNA-specific exonuclease RecJ [Psychrobium sp. MM17-31]|uniref:single-stranded-DNA-specific exonuclease RecJ n=1 Tax=Psychrobium sp. MM17-31 TaxID=2917758 RepID=UPI001EF56429|nr:single-stranded-DNA-specific exonuclease RecJ [Psychrobium sp. MM17-31]MCG7533356.1 single-stranded-DNA-specific exonuclease RecJ [Psychrobium sp. MM17-31]
MSTIVERRPAVEFDHLSFLNQPLLQRIYASRGINSATELEYQLKNLLNPAMLKDTDKAAQLLFQAITTGQKITIVGDFDADGATSTALSMLTLRRFGATDVDYIVPNRFDFGYGLSVPIVDIAHQQGTKVIMTVDNGISSIDGIAHAKALGMTVIVTDHHLAGEQLPQADAIVNPNQPDCQFASKNLAGVGVAFYVMLALRAEMRKANYFAKTGLQEPNMAEFLDIVALGTVADVVVLDSNNRILVEQGLARIKAGRTRPGIRALLEIAKRNLERIVASDMGFAIGPRLNAAGRLDDMSLGIECLLTNNEQHAREIASELDGFNKDRRAIEAGMQQEALKIIEQLPFTQDGGEVPYAFALFHPEWHQGVSGIVASRIKEKFHRPVIVFADAGDGELKGSGRSIEGLHLRDLLERINTLAPGMILKFGGHAMAAGLSIKESDYPAFAKLFEAQAQATLLPEQLSGKILTDGELHSQDFTIETAALLRDAGPWGQGFSEPCFDGRFRVVQQRIVGEKHLKLVLEPEGSMMVVDAIAFNVDLQTWPNPNIQWVEVAYKLDINEFRNKLSLQLMVEHIIPL